MLKRLDRIGEATLTTGVVSRIALAGALPLYRAIATLGDGNSGDFCLLSGDGVGFAIFRGTYRASDNTLSIDWIDASSSGSMINLAGQSTVVETVSARLINRDLPDLVQDYGADPTGAQDCAAAMQKAYEENIGPVLVPPGRFWINQPVTFDAHPPHFIGAGFTEGQYAATKYGTWLYINNTAIAPFTITESGTWSGNAGFRGFAVEQDQGPIPTAPGWGPGAYQPVWQVLTNNGRVDFDDIHLFNVSKGFYLNFSGRCHFGRISGEPLVYGLTVDTCYDLTYADEFDFYTFWSSGTGATPDTNVWNYKTANARGIILNRCDGFLADKLFALGYYAGIEFGDSSNGSATGVEIGSVYFDACRNPVLLSSANGNFRGRIGNAYLAGYDVLGGPGATLAGSHGVSIAGKGILQIGNLEVTGTGSSPVWLGSATGGGDLFIGHSTFEQWNGDNGPDDSNPVFLVSNATGGGINAITCATMPELGLPLHGTGVKFSTGTNARLTIPGWTGVGAATQGDPALVPTVDASGAVFIVNQGTPKAVMDSSGLLVINEPVSGQTGVYVTGGGVAALVGQSGSIFIASSSPSSGQIGVYYDGADHHYKINCNIGSAGAPNNLTVMNLAVRDAV